MPDTSLSLPATPMIFIYVATLTKTISAGVLIGFKSWRICLIGSGSEETFKVLARKVSFKNGSHSEDNVVLVGMVVFKEGFGRGMDPKMRLSASHSCSYFFGQISGFQNMDEDYQKFHERVLDRKAVFRV